MNIRKHWKNLLLTTTAFFWAGCNGDSVTESGCPCDNGSGISSEASSSSESVESSSSSEAVASSSSESASSSSANGSSSSEVTCTPGDSLVSYYPPSYSASVAKSNAEQKANHGGVASMEEGLRFAIREGGRTVGSGVVSKIYE